MPVLSFGTLQLLCYRYLRRHARFGSPSTLQVRSGPEYTEAQGPLRLLPWRPARAGRGLPCSEAEAASPAAEAHTDAHSSASMEEATEGASCCRGSEIPVRLLASASPAPSCNTPLHQHRPLHIDLADTSVASHTCLRLQGDTPAEHSVCLWLAVHAASPFISTMNTQER